MFSALESAKYHLEFYTFSGSLLAITINNNQEAHLVTIKAYVHPSMSEEEREELQYYTTEVISDYHIPPYNLEEKIIEVNSISKSDLNDEIVFLKNEFS